MAISHSYISFVKSSISPVYLMILEVEREIPAKDILGTEENGH